MEGVNAWVSPLLLAFEIAVCDLYLSMLICGSQHPENAEVTCQNERDHENDHYHEDAPYVYAWPLSYIERYRAGIVPLTRQPG